MSTSIPIKTEDLSYGETESLQQVEPGAVTARSTTGTLETSSRDAISVASKPSPPSPAIKAVSAGTRKHISPTPSTTAPSASSGKSKSKKKKGQVSVVMATAPSSAPGSSGAAGENTGRWTGEEHRLFLQGLEQHGKGWKKIASLIKSRTVVQIRTHAQKYFQKLSKARQNGEEGEVSMEGRNGPSAVGSGGIPSIGSHSKRRRHVTGTKRKAISSVVASATRQGKKMAAAQAAAGVAPSAPPLPAVAPALAPFVPPEPLSNRSVPSITTAHGTISGPALEDSLFRFLTPVPVTSEPGQVNDVARQVGANPITLPSDNPSTAPTASGDISPTGVNDYAIYPSWTDAKDIPSWYAKGADIDCLLDVADGLDWLADSGDLHETYDPPRSTRAEAMDTGSDDEDEGNNLPNAPSIPSLNSDALGGMGSSDAALPALFENGPPPSKKAKLSSTSLSVSPEDNVEEQLEVFDTPMEEHAFVSALLENNGESSESLPVLG